MYRQPKHVILRKPRSEKKSGMERAGVSFWKCVGFLWNLWSTCGEWCHIWSTINFVSMAKGELPTDLQFHIKGLQLAYKLPHKNTQYTANLRYENRFISIQLEVLWKFGWKIKFSMKSLIIHCHWYLACTEQTLNVFRNHEFFAWAACVLCWMICLLSEH